MLASLGCALVSACQIDLSENDSIFTNGPASRYCAATLDDATSASQAVLEQVLERAQTNREIAHLYAHKPGVTVSQARLDWLYATADALDLQFYSYPQLATATGPGIALSFDDAAVDAWHAQRPQFTAHEVKATFFVTRYDQFTADQRTRLGELAADGHAIEAHGVDHLNAYDYVERWGLAAYLEREALPSIARLRADGYPVSLYAYPFGAHTEEIDRALLEHVSAVRSIVVANQPSMDPCH